MHRGLTDHQAVINDWDIAGDATHVGVTDAEHVDFVGRRGTLRVELETSRQHSSPLPPRPRGPALGSRLGLSRIPARLRDQRGPTLSRRS